ncbi:MAG: iron-containing alcohol dehydrogenase [Anaerolineae bacterium]|jgi:alcohol dehydrogenase class IV
MWFFHSPEIAFGEFALDHLTTIQGSKALIITDENIVELGFADLVKKKLAEAGIETAVFAEVEPEPSLQTARHAAEQAHAFQPDWVIGLGGGSCMDAAKAAWFLYERPDMDLQNLSPFESLGLRAKARLIAIPTTSGTGSEVTLASVLTDTEEKRKVALGSGELVPDLAIVDPVFAMKLPPHVTADTGIDALTHAIEGYSCSWNNDFTDGLCLKAIQLVFDYLPKAYENGADDPLAREKMHNAATIAGLGFGNSFAALAHALGHALGAAFHTPHGRAVGLFLPYTVEFGANAGEGRYAEIARFLGLPASDDEEGAASFVDAIRTLTRRVGLPATVRELGISQEAYEQAMPALIDNTETDTQMVSSCRIPDTHEVEALFRYAYEGKPVDF